MKGSVLNGTGGGGSLKDMFSKMSSKAALDSVSSMDFAVERKPTPKKGGKAIEHIYQKKTQLEHILLRPDTYIGSVEPVSEKMWVYDDGKMVNKQITYVPGLYKIFDEILVNAADNKQRDSKMDTIKIEIDQENNTISIYNNGQGIPIVEHKDEKMMVPTLIFGHLLTSSNFNDEEKKVTGGRNGYGAKLCNVFSTKFTVETSNRKASKLFKQSWENNMGKAHPPKVITDTKDDYTKVIFKPDLAKFKMEALDNDIISLFQRRAYDVAGTSNGVKVFLNGKRIPIKNFKEYIEFFIQDLTDPTGKPIKPIHEKVNDRWEIAVCPSDDNFQQISFVNSIATTKGGRHVDYIADMIGKQLIVGANKKNKKGIVIKPAQIRNHMWIFVNCLIENPTFDSQTKENMTLQQRLFGSQCKPTEKFFTTVQTKSGIVENVLAWAKFKEEQIKDRTGGKKTNKVKGIPKLEDANDAGTKFSIDCTLILTEGDSAKTLAVAGLGVVGRDKYGVFPLRGKLLNVREASHTKIMENAEISHLVQILGLKYKQKYNSQEDMKTLRYGKLMIMTDQDHDGSHIKGLIINFIHHNWPSLLQRNFIEEFITPIVKLSRKDEIISFYSIPELEEWKKTHENWKKYSMKYYKGLGTSTSNEAKEYFYNIEKHRIKFRYNGANDDDTITMAFSKKCVDQRKDWLTNWMDNCKRRKEMGLSQEIIYGGDVRSITYSDFVNKELVLFSNLDNERSIPCLVDGLKPGQRKVLFTCFKRADKKEVKVAQLAGSVAEHSSYHHGEQSLMSTIINLAQNYVGSNNINILEPNGQFGTRLLGGKDCSAPRYIFTKLSALAKLIFDPKDTPLLKNLFDDNQRIEPEWYCPIIPMVLVNGADGIGTGWMTRVPNYNPREIVANLRLLINGQDPFPMNPWYKNFRGEIIELNPHKFAINGEVAILSENKLEITELPIGIWTQTYKETVLELMANGSDKVAPVLTGYREYNTDTTVRFVLEFKQGLMRTFEKEGFHKSLKLQTTTSLTSMVLFDKNGCLRRYESVLGILREFFELRCEMYEKRRLYTIGLLEAEANQLTNQARFIVEKCDGNLKIENKKKQEMINELIRRKYDSDPVGTWKKHQAMFENQGMEGYEPEADNEDDEDKKSATFNYLLGMAMWNLTLEKKQDLLRQRDNKYAELEKIRLQTPSDMYLSDLDDFSKQLDSIEKKEIDDSAKAAKKNTKKDEKGKGRVVSMKVIGRGVMEAAPSPHGERIRPVIDELLKKEEAKVKKGDKKPRIKKEKNGNLDEFDLMAGDKDSLFDKLSSSAEGKKPGKSAPGRGRKNGPSDGLKQSKLKFNKATTKGGKRKKAESSDEDESDSVLSILNPEVVMWSDEEADVKPTIRQKMAPPKKPSPTSSNDSFILPDVSGSEDDRKPVPKKTVKRMVGPKSKVAPKPKPANLLDSGSDSDSFSFDKLKKKVDERGSSTSTTSLSPQVRPTARRVAAMPKRKIIYDSDDSLDSISSDEGSDTDDDFTPSPTKKQRRS